MALIFKHKEQDTFPINLFEGDVLDFKDDAIEMIGEKIHVDCKHGFVGPCWRCENEVKADKERDQRLQRKCDTCKSWAWDCMEPDGICMNKSKKKCTPEKRELWQPNDKSCITCLSDINGGCYKRTTCHNFDKWQPISNAQLIKDEVLKSCHTCGGYSRSKSGLAGSYECTKARQYPKCWRSKDKMIIVDVADIGKKSFFAGTFENATGNEYKILYAIDELKAEIETLKKKLK